MNSATRMPGGGERGAGLAQRVRACPATSRPPSVVISARRSGTRQQSAGRMPRAIADHLVGHGHLEVHARLQRRTHRRDVGILDVAPVLAQVQRDVVGARLLGDEGGVHRVGIARAPRLAQRRHVVDVDTECDACRLHRAFPLTVPVRASERATARVRSSRPSSR